MENKVKEYRIEKGYTQEKVARLCNISLRQLQYIEYGKVIPSVFIALKLASILEVDNVNKLFLL